MSRPYIFSVGITGTREGAKPAQRRKLASSFDDVLRVYPYFILHQGCCIGVDEYATKLAKALNMRVYGHPPDSQGARFSRLAFDLSDVQYPAKPYLIRNDAIVAASAFLIGVPNSFERTVRSGTWSTIRKAQELKRKVRIIYPNGDMEDNFETLSL